MAARDAGCVSLTQLHQRRTSRPGDGATGVRGGMDPEWRLYARRLRRTSRQRQRQKERRN